MPGVSSCRGEVTDPWDRASSHTAAVPAVVSKAATSVKPLCWTSDRLQAAFAKSLSTIGPPAAGADDVIPGSDGCTFEGPGGRSVVLPDPFVDRSTSERATRQAKTNA